MRSPSESSLKCGNGLQRRADSRLHVTSGEASSVVLTTLPVVFLLLSLSPREKAQTAGKSTLRSFTASFLNIFQTGGLGLSPLIDSRCTGERSLWRLSGLTRAVVTW